MVYVAQSDGKGANLQSYPSGLDHRLLPVTTSDMKGITSKAKGTRADKTRAEKTTKTRRLYTLEDAGETL